MHDTPPPPALPPSLSPPPVGSPPRPDLPPPPDHPVATRASDGRPSRGTAIAYHLVGAVLTGGAAVLALGAVVLISFGTSTCGDSFDPDLVRDLRQGLVLIGLALAAVPGLWALLGARLRVVWAPWAALAALAACSGIAMAAGTNEVSSWCF